MKSLRHLDLLPMAGTVLVLGALLVGLVLGTQIGMRQGKALAARERDLSWRAQ